MKTVGIVLAGGQSRRFGSPKAFFQYNNIPFYEYAVKALEPHCHEVVVSTQKNWKDQFPNTLRVVVDLPTVKGEGPLAGIYSVMETVQACRYIVLPCDMPFINAEIIGELIRQYQPPISAVTIDTQRHPLVSIWESGLKEQLQFAFQQGHRSVIRALKGVSVHWIESEQLTSQYELAFLNVNTLEQWEGRDRDERN